MHHGGGESTRAHKNSDVGGFYRGTRARATPTRCRYPLQEVTAPPLAGLGAVIMRDLTVRDCAHTYGEPPRGRRSQGAKDRLGPCARIANLQADAQHIEREMAQLRTELEQALRPWWRLGRRRQCTVSEPSRPYVGEPEPIPEVEALAAAEAMARSRRKGSARMFRLSWPVWHAR